MAEEIKQPEQVEEQEGQEQEQQQPDEAQKTDKEEKLFTQDEMNEILRKRLERQQKQFEKKYGSDLEDRLRRLEELEQAEKERKQAEMSDAERLQAQLEELQKERESLAQQLQQVQSRAREQAIYNEFMKAANEHGIAYVEDAWALSAKRLSEIEFDEDGKPLGVADIVAELAKQKPFLLKQDTQPRTIGGANAPKPQPEKTKEQRLKEAAEKARKSQRVEDLIAYAALKRELGL
jgi:predicted RNase H-like nuclease (RuvC/YqgF family)